MERKKIAFLDEGRGLGGAEINLLTILGALDSNSYDMSVIVSCKDKFYNKLNEAGVKTIVIATPPFLSTSITCRDKRIPNPLAVFYNILLVLLKSILLWNYLRKSDIDIIQTNALFEHIYGGISAKMSNRSCIWHMQDIVSKRFLLGLGRNFINISAKILPEKIIAISQATKDAFCPGVQHKISRIYNGIDVEKFSSGPASSDTICRQLGISPGGGPIVLTTSRIVPWKGHKDFIAAAKKVHDKIPEAKFLIIGDDTFGEKGYFKQLKNLTEELQLTETVIFTGFAKNIEEILKIADVFVHCPVLPEPFGLSLAEAMASAKAVVATNMGGPIEIITDGKDGILIEPNNPEALSEAILDLLGSSDKRLALGEAAQVTCRERFSIARFVREWESLYGAFDTAKEKRKILFLHQTWKGFEKADYGILRKHFSVREVVLHKNFLYKTFFLINDMKKSDIVFCWFAYPALLPALLMARIFRKKIIIVAGGWAAACLPEISFGSMRPGLKNSLKRTATKWILSLANKIIAVSQFNKNELIHQAGVAPGKITLIPLGLEITGLEKESDIRKNNNMILTVGAINKENMTRKGLKTFLEVAKLLPEKEFILAGGSKKNFGRHVSGDTPANVKLINFTEKEVEKLYHEAKVYVQASLHENFGLSLAEAMLKGCVPVVSDKAALPELVADTGYYVPYDDVERLAEAIQKASQDNTKGQKARERIIEFFSLDRRGKELVFLLSSAVTK